MTDTQGSKHAVILSGGGANGAYEVGVMKALFAGLSPATNYWPLNPDIFVGTSVGSYNAAFLVAQWAAYGSAAIANLEQVWLDKVSSNAQKCDNGVFRVRATPTAFINPTCFIPNPLWPFIELATDSAFLAWDGLQRAVNVVIAQETPLLQRISEAFNFASFISLQPFAQTLRETIQYADIRRAEKALRITATNWETGVLHIYDNNDMTDQFGPLALMASASIPGFFPPTELGSQSFVDGGVLMNTPLTLAISAGADILHVIYLDPKIENIPLTGLQNTLEAMYRIQIIGWAKALNNDLTAAKHINREVAYAHLIANTLDIIRRRAPNDNFFKGIPLEDIEQHLQQSLKYKQLTIHLYHPRDDLGGALGVLNFDRDRMQGLIERGFDDATDYTSDAYEVIRPLPIPALPSQPASGAR